MSWWAIALIAIGSLAAGFVIGGAAAALYMGRGMWG